MPLSDTSRFKIWRRWILRWNVALLIGSAASCTFTRPRLATETPSAPWQCLVAGSLSEPERLAAIDAQVCIAQVTGRVPAMLSPDEWQRHPVPAVLVGTPDSNPLIAGLVFDTVSLGDEGFVLANRRIDGCPVIVVASGTPQGTVAAIYGLLRELGFGFYLGSNAVPPSFPSRLSRDTFVQVPAFSIRGVLPWHNFFDSPTAWDPADYRSLMDQLIRSGANFVGFHSYDTEPFAAYGENGRAAFGDRLLNTGASTWGTRQVACADFGFGTSMLFRQRHFGAATAESVTTDTLSVILMEQSVLRDALDYAHRRGLHACVGFELGGDPTAPEDRTRFLRRLQNLLETYPAADFIWLWQSEATGATGYNYSPLVAAGGNGVSTSSTLLSYGLWRQTDFDRVVNRVRGEGPYYQDTEIGKISRATEGARLEQFARLARRALQCVDPAPRLILSGWGGDQRLLSADYYEGLDRLLPNDVVFASLDHIIPRKRIDAVYHQLPASRERWPIIWLEFDGDQWHPQPNVHTYQSLLADALRSGSQGILGIHWRTREIEENFAFAMEFAWQSGLTPDQFFQDYARRCYPPAIAAPMANIHSRLDQLGYRWIGGAGQSECGYFAWGPGEDSKRKSLEALRRRAAALLPKAGASKPRLQWVIDRMDWVLLYDRAERGALKASALLHNSATSTDTIAANARQALRQLQRGNLAEALRAYANRVTTRGEYGVLATINTKAVPAWRELTTQCLQLARIASPQITSDWSPNPRILVPRLLTSVEAGRDFPVEAIVLVGHPSWIHYRTAGTREWSTLPMKCAGGWVFAAVLPTDAVTTPAIELGLSFSPVPQGAMDYGPISVAVFPPAVTEWWRRTVSPPFNSTAQFPLQSHVDPDQFYSLSLHWPDSRGAHYYRVRRNGQLLGDTCVPAFPDIPTSSTQRYDVEARTGDYTLARSDVASVSFSPTESPTASLNLKARVNPWGVFLSWDSPSHSTISEYRILRTRTDVCDAPTTQIARLSAIPVLPNRFHDDPPPGRLRYRVEPMRAGVAISQQNEVDVDTSSALQQRILVDSRLTDPPAGGTIEGAVTFDSEGALFKDGAVALPARPAERLPFGTTVRFEFRPDSISDMPVLLSCGMWQTDGWFAQILNEQLYIRTRAGDAIGPGIQPGTWYSVEWEYRGGPHRLMVNGKAYQQLACLPQPEASPRRLVIGQYEVREPRYAFHGRIRNLQILTDDGEEPKGAR